MSDAQSLVALRATHRLRGRQTPKKISRAVGEALESRLLLTGTVAGTLWNDSNANGIWDDPGGLAGWTVNLLQNGARVQQTVSNTWGKFWFSAPAGSYVVAPQAPSGFRPTNSAGTAPVTLADGQTIGPALGYTNGPGGTITGSIFNDVNNDGVREPGEPALPTWTVYLDRNNNGQFDAGESFAITNSTGSFRFNQLIAGTYAARVMVPPGFHPTGPTSFNATVANGTTAALPAFSFAAGAGVTINGYVINDLNDNALWESGDPALANWTVDLSQGGVVVRKATTDSYGFFSVVAVAGTYSISAEAQPGFRITYPAAGAYATTLADGQSTLAVLTYTNAPGASLTGAVYKDSNNNASFDPAEPGLAGWTAYLDLNQNGQFDPGEPTAITNANGVYQFSQLVSGSYTVRLLVPSNYHVTGTDSYTAVVVSGQTSAHDDFGVLPGAGVLVYGTLFDDVNDNGFWDFGENPLANWSVSLLQKGSVVRTAVTDSQGRFKITETGGGYLLVADPQPGYRPSSAPPTGTRLILPNGANSGNLYLGYTEAAGGTIAGTVFNDTNEDGIQNAGEAPLAGWTVYLDSNFNGRLDPPEPAAVTDRNGRYRFTKLVAGDYLVRVAAPSGFHVTGPSSYVATVANGTVVTAPAFGFAPGAGVGLYGTLFNDANDNGTWDSGETALSGWTVDLEQNGAVVRQTSTDSFGRFSFIGAAGTYSIAAELPPGYRASNSTARSLSVTLADGQNSGNEFMGFTNAPGGTISGTVFNDADGDGQQEAGDGGLAGWTVYLDLSNDSQLDPGDPSTLTDANGAYSFSQLVAGAYIVRVVQQPDTRQTAPDSFSHVQSVSNGVVSSGNDFGFAPGAGVSISGDLLNDSQALGLWNGQGPLVGWTVYLDNNNNGQWDPGEPQTITNGNGQWGFSELPPGYYTVRYVNQPGYYLSFPATDAYNVTLFPGQSAGPAVWGLTTANGVIRGTVLNDLAASGNPTPGDPGIAHWGVYIDANGNGKIDPGERWTVTDAKGNFSFSRLPAGSYSIAVDPDMRNWIPTAGIGAETIIASDGLSPALPVTFLYRQALPAHYSANQLVDYFLIGGTSTDNATRTIGYGSLRSGGWTKFIAQQVQPDLAWGARRIELHNPFGGLVNETYIEADQYLNAQAAGLHWLTDDFVTAWKPVTATGVEVIAYVGNPDETASFQVLAKAGDSAGWLAHFNACVAPLVQAHMSIAIDHSAGVAEGSLLWQAMQSLRVQGTKVYVEIRPSEATPYLWDVPTIGDNLAWLNNDPYRNPDPVISFNAKNSELAVGSAVRLFITPPTGDNWSDLGWLFGSIESVLSDDDVAGISVSLLRANGYTLQQLLTPA